MEVVGQTSPPPIQEQHPIHVLRQTDQWIGFLNLEYQNFHYNQTQDVKTLNMFMRDLSVAMK